MSSWNGTLRSASAAHTYGQLTMNPELAGEEKLLRATVSSVVPRAGPPTPVEEIFSMMAAALRPAEGMYRQSAERAWVLRVVGGGLTVQRIGSRRLPLTPVARDVFVYPDGIARMTLERDAGGAVNAMRFFADGIGESESTARSDEAMPGVER